jgi:hypothetical protein
MPNRAKRWTWALLGWACIWPAAALADGGSAAELFKGADLSLGEQLIAQNQCNECHIRRVGGDGSSIYKPIGRINTPRALRGMVDYCSTQLNLGMFPEEVTAVAAVLQRDHYRFGLPPAAASAPR